jgi:CheY-like chemotaxis protein
VTARPPRASTKSEGRGEAKPGAKAEAKPARRARTRGATQGEREDTARRAPSVVPTDRYERIGDDDVLEVVDLPAPEPGGAPRLRMLVLEAAPHLAAAQGAIVAAGHAVVIGATGRDGVDKLRFAVGEVDAMLVGMPGGEPLIELAAAQGARRPVVIAAWTASALEAARRSAAAGADLATVRPHDVERLAPILLAATRLVEHRRPGAPLPATSAGAPAPAPAPAELDVDVDVDLDVDGDVDGDGEPDREPAGLLAAESFAQAAQRELERARRFGHPLAVAMFVVDVPAPPPPPGLRGILRARAGNALVHALRDADLATELDQDRFLVVMPYTDRVAGAEHARRIVSAVAAGDPVNAAGRSFPPRVIGAVVGAPGGAELDLPRLVQDATQLLEQAQVTGASLAVES